MTGRKFLSPALLWLAPQSDRGSAACAETEAFFQFGPPQSFFQLSWLALQKARRAQICKPPLLWLVPQSDHGSAACAETEAFFQYGPPQSFFQLSWLALQKARREVRATLMTGRKFLSPPLLWLSPQSDHGSAARAETEAFFQYGPPQSFFQLSWLALQKARREVGARTDDRAQISQPPPSYGSLRNPVTGVPRARKLKLFSNMARCNPFSSLTQLARPTKSTCAGSWRKD